MKAREAKIPAPSAVGLPEAGARIIQLYKAWGKPEKATNWQRILTPSGDKVRPKP